MIPCRDWLPWRKHGSITMTKRQSNNQRSDGISAQPARKHPECKNALQNFSPPFFLDQGGILLIDYLPKRQTIDAAYYSSLLVQLKDILKEKRRVEGSKVVLFLHDNVPIHRALAIQKKTGLPVLPISRSPTLFS